MAGGMGGGILGTVAEMSHHTSAVNGRLADAEAKVSSLPGTASPQDVKNASRSLSAAQFNKTATNIGNASKVADAVHNSESGSPDIGDPAWTPPNSIGTGLYT